MPLPKREELEMKSLRSFIRSTHVENFTDFASFSENNDLKFWVNDANDDEFAGCADYSRTDFVRIAVTFFVVHRNYW
jgi:hypothetical protein